MDLGASSLIVTQSVSVFNNFLPKLTDVRRADPNDWEHRADVHLGELAACAMIVGTSVITATIAESQVPIIVGVVMCLFLVAIYEYALSDKRSSNASV